MNSDLEDIGYRAAEALGLEVLAVLGAGLDGMAFALEDGDVLKITRSEDEAALAALMADGALPGGNEVLAEIRMVAEIETSGERRLFAIVKEEIADVFEDPSDEERLHAIPEWKAAFSMLVSGFMLESEDRIECGIAWADPERPDLRKFADAIKALAGRHGVMPGDLACSNVGIGKGGELRVRDWGGFRMKGTMASEVRYRALHPESSGTQP